MANSSDRPTRMTADEYRDAVLEFEQLEYDLAAAINEFVYYEVEKWDEIEQGGAFLDPLPFAARLVAHVAELTNEVLKILDPSADPRIPAEYLSRISTPGPETWASPSGAAVARLASPVSGLTDWVTSPSAE